jgi:prepilin-type N-terminal cleavage/methylation domain-containing protein
MTSAGGRTGEAGFTLIEVLVASAILLMLIAAAFELLHAAQLTFVTEPAAVDLHQRLRVVADVLTRDLRMAGAGFSRGKHRGSLAGLIAPIVPYRVGLRNADAPGSFLRDRFSVVYIPAGAPEATLGDPIAAPAATVRINAGAGCALVNQACGFQAGMSVLVVDEGGRFNLFTVMAVAGNLVDLQLRDPVMAAAFGTGASVGAVVVESYSLKTEPASQTFQLLEYDGYRSEQPVSDDIVGMQVEYFGEPEPPALVRPPTDPDGPWTTYGPKPPAPGVDDPLDAWPAGENCAFAMQGAAQVPRLARFGVPGDGLVALNAAVLTDGPWCPDSLAPNRFDADLLRVRRVRVSLRAQVASASLRGAGSLFARPGTSRGGGSMVPDAHITVDVAARNLNAGR